MAGSISRKARGLRVKIWTKLQFLLAKGGLRVDYWKLQGLFNKKCQANRYAPIWTVGSGSEGWDLMSFGSNQGRGFQIGRPG